MGWVWCPGCQGPYSWDQWGGQTYAHEWELKWVCRACMYLGYSVP
jgi:hypothetical protein